MVKREEDQRRVLYMEQHIKRAGIKYRDILPGEAGIESILRIQQQFSATGGKLDSIALYTQHGLYSWGLWGMDIHGHDTVFDKLLAEDQR